MVMAERAASERLIHLFRGSMAGVLPRATSDGRPEISQPDRYGRGVASGPIASGGVAQLSAGLKNDSGRPRPRVWGAAPLARRGAALLGPWVGQQFT